MLVMGLGSKRVRKPFRHSILDLSSLDGIESYLKQTGSHGVRNTMLVQIDRTMVANHIITNTVTNLTPSWRHFVVIFHHERGLYSTSRALLQAVLRFLSLSLMVGTIDEYYCAPPNGSPQLVAFASTIVKGNTLRGMWFYQRPSYGRCMIWFHTVRTALQRGFRMGLRHVDLGPSVDSRVAAIKSRFGFEYSSDWQTVCDYSGAFRYDIPPASTWALAPVARSPISPCSSSMVTSPESRPSTRRQRHAEPAPQYALGTVCVGDGHGTTPLSG